MERPRPDMPASQRLARDLLVAEGLATDGGTNDGRAAPPEACAAVLERLFDRLAPVIGRGGFESLTGRAAVVAARAHPSLGRLSVTPEGPPSAAELTEALGESDGADPSEVATRLVGEFLEFLGRLVGWRLTLVFLRDVWPEPVAHWTAADLDRSSRPRSTGDEG